MEVLEGGGGAGGQFVITALVRIILVVAACVEKTTVVWRSGEFEQHGRTNRRRPAHLGTCAECRWSGAGLEMLLEEKEESV